MLKEKQALIDAGAYQCEQQNPHHIYTVGVHTEKVVEYCLEHGADDELVRAAWLHDIGKMKVKKMVSETRAIFTGHAAVSAEIAKKIGESNYVINLIYWHDAAMMMDMGQPVPFEDLASFGRAWCKDLALLMEADQLAQHPTFKMEQKQHTRMIFVEKLFSVLNSTKKSEEV